MAVFFTDATNLLNYKFSGSARVARFILQIFYAHIFNLNGKLEVNTSSRLNSN